MYIGYLVLSGENPIVTVEIASHQFLLSATVLLQKLLIGIFYELLIVGCCRDEEDHLVGHHCSLGQLLEVVLVFFVIRDVEDYEGEVLEELVVDLVVMLVVLALQFVSEKDIEGDGAVM
jgi:hypothetical protein